ncbi:hypothetical protein EDD11_002556 [Mortierella claussenii]|nr:hypothetical protein EDD11_002556 [Mortierella claussenii]
MHRAARSLTINTSNACLVNKFNSTSSSVSSTSSGGRPYTPPPPSCRLHKIYEEKLEVLGSLGYENWFDDHANPFYRRSEPILSCRTLGRSKNHNNQREHTTTKNDTTLAIHSEDQNPFELVDIVIESVPSNNACMNPFIPQKQPPQTQLTVSSVDNGQSRIVFSTEFTGFESLDSDSEPEEMIDFFGDKEDADETRGLFFTGGFMEGSSGIDGDHTSNKGGNPLSSFRSEMEYRRLSNRNRIMDRGHLMPDTTIYLPLPLSREPRFISNSRTAGSAKVRAHSPYPRSRSFVRQD